MITSQPDFRYVKILAHEPNCFHKPQMLFLIETFEVWQRILELLK
jgi:hypothetical protein